MKNSTESHPKSSKQSKPYVMTPKRRAALKLGKAIRNVVCMDSLANRFFPQDLREKVRELCDEQMHRLGYESITEQAERHHKIFEDWDKYSHLSESEHRKLFKYQRLGKL